MSSNKGKYTPAEGDKVYYQMTRTGIVGKQWGRLVEVLDIESGFTVRVNPSELGVVPQGPSPHDPKDAA